MDVGLEGNRLAEWIDMGTSLPTGHGRLMVGRELSSRLKTIRSYPVPSSKVRSFVFVPVVFVSLSRCLSPSFVPLSFGSQLRMTLAIKSSPGYHEGHSY